MEEKKEPINLAIIIPVFNNLRYTKKCLESLNEIQQAADLTNEEIKIIIVDDGSTDGTFEWVKENYPEVIILQGDGNLWWSGGINMGVKHALETLQCNYILWWNNDIKPQKDYLKCLWSKINSLDEKIIIGSKIYIEQTLKVWGMGGCFNPKTGYYDMLGFDDDDKELYKQPVESDWFPGMGTTFHKSVFDVIGFVNESDFPQYHGDSDFTYRAKINGFKLICYPDLVLFNDISNSGLVHKGDFRNFRKTLVGINAFYNIGKELKFYQLYAKSPLAYLYLAGKYARYIGGFIKWKIFGWIGIRKQYD